MIKSDVVKLALVRKYKKATTNTRISDSALPLDDTVRESGLKSQQQQEASSKSAFITLQFFFTVKYDNRVTIMSLAQKSIFPKDCVITWFS